MRQSCLKMLVRLCPRAPVVNSSDLLAAIFFSLFFGPTQAQPPTSSSVAELPGPSPALHAAAFHTCVRNFYAATNGNDRNPGTLAQPWATIQHADTSSRAGGDCINVAPGFYQASVLIRHGGTSPTSRPAVRQSGHSLRASEDLHHTSAGRCWDMLKSLHRLSVVRKFNIM